MNAADRAHDARRRRQLVTPEGVPLDIVLATRGARLMALVLDYTIIFFSMILVFVVLLVTGVNLDAIEDNGVGEFLFVLFITVFYPFFSEERRQQRQRAREASAISAGARHS